MDTLHCALENGADLYVNERQKIQNYRARSGEERRRKRRRKKNAKSRFFTSRGAYVNCAIIAGPSSGWVRGVRTNHPAAWGGPLFSLTISYFHGSLVDKI